VRREKSCGAVVYRKVNGHIEYLLVKSTGPDSFWGFPKGHIEDGETEEETCIREVLEETGIQITLKENFRVTDEYCIDEEIDKEVVYFLGEAENGQVKIQEEEIECYKWGTFNEAVKLLTFDSVRNVLSKGNEFLTSI
jgi:8-oxo-dGTP pyrophosphatase MutT (NUDIX family)